MSDAWRTYDSMVAAFFKSSIDIDHLRNGREFSIMMMTEEAAYFVTSDTHETASPVDTLRFYMRAEPIGQFVKEVVYGEYRGEKYPIWQSLVK